MHFCRKTLSLRFTHFFLKLFWTEKQNPKSFLLLGCMHNRFSIDLHTKVTAGQSDNMAICQTDDRFWIPNFLLMKTPCCSCQHKDKINQVPDPLVWDGDYLTVKVSTGCFMWDLLKSTWLVANPQVPPESRRILRRFYINPPNSPHPAFSYIPPSLLHLPLSISAPIGPIGSPTRHNLTFCRLSYICAIPKICKCVTQRRFGIREWSNLVIIFSISIMSNVKCPFFTLKLSKESSLWTQFQTMLHVKGCHWHVHYNNENKQTTFFQPWQALICAFQSSAIRAGVEKETRGSLFSIHSLFGFSITILFYFIIYNGFT